MQNEKSEKRYQKRKLTLIHFKGHCGGWVENIADRCDEKGENEETRMRSSHRLTDCQSISSHKDQRGVPIQEIRFKIN